MDILIKNTNITDVITSTPRIVDIFKSIYRANDYVTVITESVTGISSLYSDWLYIVSKICMEHGELSDDDLKEKIIAELKNNKEKID